MWERRNTSHGTVQATENGASPAATRAEDAAEDCDGGSYDRARVTAFAYGFVSATLSGRLFEALFPTALCLVQTVHVAAFYGVILTTPSPVASRAESHRSG